MQILKEQKNTIKHTPYANAPVAVITTLKNKRLPELSNFLNEFGLNAAKPDEAMSIEEGGYIDYIGVDYTVCGFILTTGKNGFDIQGNVPLHINIHY